MAQLLRSLVLGVGVLVTGSLGACGGHGNDRASPTAPAGLVADFTVRGTVTQLPEAGKPASSFRVHHEPIPEWKKNYNEAPVGMNAMVMEFPPASPKVIEGIAVGDVIRMTFRVEYDEEGRLAGWKATKVEQLPSETELTFE